MQQAWEKDKPIVSDKGSKCSSCFWRTESTHRSCLCRQNVLKAIPGQRAGGSTESSTLGPSTCTCALQGMLHFGSELMSREYLLCGLLGCGRAEGQPRLQHTTFSPTQAEWSQHSHKSFLCFLHPWPLQRPLFSVLSLPFLKKAPYYPGNPVAFLSFPYLVFSVVSKPDPT